MWQPSREGYLSYTSFTQRLSDALLNKGQTQMGMRLLMNLIAQDELDEKTVKLLLKGLTLQKNKEALTRRFEQFGTPRVFICHSENPVLSYEVERS